MKSLLLSLLLVVIATYLWVVLPQESHAESYPPGPSCPGYRTVSGILDAVERSEVVFTGKVVNVTYLETPGLTAVSDGREIHDSVTTDWIFEFEVDRVYRGQAQTTTYVRAYKWWEHDVIELQGANYDPYEVGRGSRYHPVRPIQPKPYNPASPIRPFDLNGGWDAVVFAEYHQSIEPISGSAERPTFASDIALYRDISTLVPVSCAPTTVLPLNYEFIRVPILNVLGDGYDPLYTWPDYKPDILTELEMKKEFEVQLAVREEELRAELSAQIPTPTPVPIPASTPIPAPTVMPVNIGGLWLTIGIGLGAFVSGVVATCVYLVWTSTRPSLHF